MKAKDWYNKMLNTSSNEEFEEVITNCLKSLSDDAMQLIKIRRAKSDDAVAACINEVNNKWIAICRMLESDKENGKFETTHPMADAYLDKDGFRASFVHLHPKYGWCFDLKRHKAKMEAKQERLTMKDLHNPTLILMGLTPLDKIDEEFLKNKASSEILHCYILISNLHNSTTPANASSNMVFMKIIAAHVHLLKCWKQAGKADLSDIEAMYSPFTTSYEYLSKKYGVMA